jgi:hypothetical protein
MTPDLRTELTKLLAQFLYSHRRTHGLSVESLNPTLDDFLLWLESTNQEQTDE